MGEYVSACGILNTDDCLPQALTLSGNIVAMGFDRGGKIRGGVLFGAAFVLVKISKYYRQGGEIFHRFAGENHSLPAVLVNFKQKKAAPQFYFFNFVSFAKFD